MCFVAKHVQSETLSDGVLRGVHPPKSHDADLNRSCPHSLPITPALPLPNPRLVPIPY